MPLVGNLVRKALAHETCTYDANADRPALFLSLLQRAVDEQHLVPFKIAGPLSAS